MSPFSAPVKVRVRLKWKKSGLSQIIGNENGTILENQHAADYMTEYYVNAGPNLAKEFDDVWSKETCKVNVADTFKFAFVTEIQIMELIKNIDSCKSSAIEN